MEIILFIILLVLIGIYIESRKVRKSLQGIDYIVTKFWREATGRDNI